MENGKIRNGKIKKKKRKMGEQVTMATGNGTRKQERITGN